METSVMASIVGMLCATKYAHDGLWYRAEVVEIRGGCQVSIRYVDYGNIELMSVWKLKKLLDIFLMLPAQVNYSYLFYVVGKLPKHHSRYPNVL